jgi:hypothetical protein
VFTQTVPVIAKKLPGQARELHTGIEKAFFFGFMRELPRLEHVDESNSVQLKI